MGQMIPVNNQRPSDTDILSRARGCLLGQLAGDALGSLVEFRAAEDIRREYPSGVYQINSARFPLSNSPSETPRS
jgi:ADP-ribosylglycohydrolase